MGKKRKGVWMAAPLFIFWIIWRARNRIAFEEEISIQNFEELFCTSSLVGYCEEKNNSLIFID